MFGKIFLSAVLSVAFFGNAFAKTPDVDINQAFRVYDKITGELILDCAFEPVLVKSHGCEYVIMTVCDMHGDCAAYEFENRILLEKLSPEDIVDWRK